MNLKSIPMAARLAGALLLLGNVSATFICSIGDGAGIEA